MRSRQQFCDYCGAALGMFAHSRRLDGPLCCPASECNREAAHDAREQDDMDDRDRDAREANS